MLALLPEQERTKILNSFSNERLNLLKYDWEFWGRPNQLEPPGDWKIWLILAGRGWGKTRTGAEFVLKKIREGYRRIALVAPTAADARDVMVEGESGILAISPPWDMPNYEPSKRRITWNNGAIATLYAAERPDRLRGPQHDLFWADELATWKYIETWDMLMFGLRLGDNPMGIVTTTPRPIKLLKELIKEKNTHTTKGSTYENRGNLASVFFEKIITKYEGTRLGRQEIDAEILDDNPNALWSRANIEDNKVTKHPALRRIVVAIDPATTDNETSDETGIIVAGLGVDGKGYVLDDLSLKDSPHGWGKQAVTGYYKHQADRIIGEVNNGGDMIEYVIKSVDSTVPFKKVHASRGKITRAEPVAALYEQNKIHHVGNFPQLEDQLCEWEPGQGSPDRMDALVWAITELMLDGTGRVRSISKSKLGI